MKHLNFSNDFKWFGSFQHSSYVAVNECNLEFVNTLIIQCVFVLELNKHKE